MFDKKKDRQARLIADKAMPQTELERLRAMPLQVVAAEVMTRTFGRGSPAQDGEIRSDEIADGLLPESLRQQPIRRLDHAPTGYESDPYWPFKSLVREGFQVLERCGMVVMVPA